MWRSSRPRKPREVFAHSFWNQGGLAHCARTHNPGYPFEIMNPSDNFHFCMDRHPRTPASGRRWPNHFPNVPHYPSENVLDMNTAGEPALSIWTLSAFFGGKKGSQWQSSQGTQHDFVAQDLLVRWWHFQTKNYSADLCTQSLKPHGLQ